MLEPTNTKKHATPAVPGLLFISEQNKLRKLPPSQAASE